MTEIGTILSKSFEKYRKTTPKKLQVIDCYLLYVLLTGIILFVYCLLVGTFPFNSFLSGFISCVSCFVLAGYKSIRRIRISSMESAPKEVLQTLSSPTSFCIL